MSDKKNFNVVEIDNGYIFQAPGATVSFTSAKQLVAYLREYLGLPSQGRPKLEKTNVVQLHEVEA